MKSRRRTALVLAFAVACASPAEPPGGPPDLDPPKLVHVAPDSGRVQVKTRQVELQFDEVIAESPRGAQNLAGIVLISPVEGDPVVEWHRSRITIRPRKGWRAGTTYVVTVLPGIADLKGNARDTATTIVFSTGDSIPRTRVSGVAFDWTKAAPAARALVTANPAGDSTLTYVTETDSTGHFVIPFLPRGSYIVRAGIDANRNRKIDTREHFDTAAVTLTDSASLELYAFPHDSLGPRLRSVQVADSGSTLHLTFDRPVSPDSGYLPSVEIRAATADSAVLATGPITTWAAFLASRDAAAKAARAAEIAADTSTARREAREKQRRDSIERAATIQDSIARDPKKRVPPPVSKRPALVTEFAIVLPKPLEPGIRYVAVAKARGIIAGEQTSQTSFSRPKPTAPATPPGARKDTLGVARFRPVYLPQRH
ncbi:MAG TPA: Ig-like domain-containing protein [Gemmatimonadaceae bacterium]|nr:Ig-like domain-containing protein [Gemmatimonadaceae bacterium]